MSARSQQAPEIHGHRGARGLFPENSLSAVEAGIDAGCDAIEVDICVSKDNQLVIHHDPVLSSRVVRDPTGNWVSEGIRVRECTLVELKRFDIGRINPTTTYSKIFASQKSIDGTRIPTLAEFVDLVLACSSSVALNFELKSTPYDTNTTPPIDEYVDIVVNDLSRFNIVDRLFLQSFDWRLALNIKGHLAKLKIGLLTDQQSTGNPISPISGRPTLWTNMNDIADFSSIAAMVKSAGGNVWSSNYLDLTQSDVETAHELGLEVYCWTVNEHADMARMIEWDVDAITTDYPNRLAQLIEA